MVIRHQQHCADGLLLRAPRLLHIAVVVAAAVLKLRCSCGFAWQLSHFAFGGCFFRFEALHLQMFAVRQAAVSNQPAEPLLETQVLTQIVNEQDVSF